MLTPKELRYIRDNLRKARAEQQATARALDHLDLLLTPKEPPKGRSLQEYYSDQHRIRQLEAERDKYKAALEKYLRVYQNAYPSQAEEDFWNEIVALLET